MNTPGIKSIWYQAVATGFGPKWGYEGIHEDAFRMFPDGFEWQAGSMNYDKSTDTWTANVRPLGGDA